MTEQMSEEEYLRSEELSPIKREYVGGYVYGLHGDTLAQAGATSGQGQLCNNLILALVPNARKRGCSVYQADMRVYIQTPASKPTYYYPDVIATYEPMDKKAIRAQAPNLIVEVLSPRTRHTDLSDKIWAYTSLASLQLYLIVEPDTRLIRVIERSGEGWAERELTETGQIELPFLGIVLTLDDVYDSVL